MKKALMAAAALIALPVMAQASGTSIKIDTPSMNFKETGINFLFSDAAAYRSMQDVKVVELSALKIDAVGMGIGAVVIDNSMKQVTMDYSAPAITGQAQSMQIDKGAHAIDGKLFLATTRKSAVPRDRTRWAPPTPPAPLALGVDKSFVQGRSNLSAAAIDFQGRNNDLAGEGGPAVDADGVRKLQTARPWGWISPSDTIGGGSGAISRS